jgi:two-component system response regulator MtrA
MATRRDERRGKKGQGRYVQPLPAEGGPIEYAGVAVDVVRRRAFAGGRELALTPTEFRLLEQLVGRQGEALPRARLAEAVLRGANADLRAIDQHVKCLRRKLGSRARIETVWRVGYRLGSGDAAPRA